MNLKKQLTITKVFVSYFKKGILMGLEKLSNKVVDIGHSASVQSSILKEN